MATMKTITLEKASQITGMSKKVLTEKIKSGQLKATKPAKEILVFADSLEQMLKRYEIKVG